MYEEKKDFLGLFNIISEVSYSYDLHLLLRLHVRLAIMHIET